MTTQVLARAGAITAAVLLALDCSLASPVAQQWGGTQPGPQPGGIKSADFVVIGGGTAGLTVASRLAEANFSVLLLEAGGFPDRYGLPWDSASLTSDMSDSPVDWNFTSLPIPGLNGRSVAQHRGLCLGGTSSINGLTYGRGSASVYDNWQAMGNPGWGWDAVQQYFERTTYLVPPPSEDHFRTYNSSLYNPSGGPAQLGYTNYNPPSIDAFVESLPSIDIPIAIDLNNGTNVGGKHELSWLAPANQTRVSSYSAFWNDTVSRPNFEGITFAVVQKILFRHSGNQEPVAYGVEYNFPFNGTSQTEVALANKEVILSAGTLQTPQILQLSGIGPRETLDSLQIPVVYDNEWVGKHLKDVPTVQMILQSTDAASTNQFQQNMTAQMIAEVAKAQNPASPTDPLNTIDGISGPAYSFKKLNLSDLEAVGAYNLIANQSDQAHLELILWTSLYPPPKNVPTINDYYNFTAANWEEKSYVTLSSYLLAPSTSGTLTINSTDASKTPVINISYYEAASDMNIQILSLRRLRTLISQPEFSKYTVGPANGELIPGPNVQSDEDLATFIRETSVSSAHQSGTASMRPLDDEGVVSSELKVYGVQGLRVVDASIMPLFIDQHPTAAIYMIAEKASAMIIEEYESDDANRNGGWKNFEA